MDKIAFDIIDAYLYKMYKVWQSQMAIQNGLKQFRVKATKMNPERIKRKQSAHHKINV